MAGMKKTRAKINAVLAQEGLPALAPEQPIPAVVKQAAAVARREARHVIAETSGRARRGEELPAVARGRARNERGLQQTVADPAEIEVILTNILRNPTALPTARIQAAEKLMAMKGNAPQFQKYTLEIVLSRQA